MPTVAVPMGFPRVGTLLCHRPQGGSPSRLFRWSVYRYLLVYRGQGRIGFCRRVGATPGVDLVPKTVAVPMGFGFDRTIAVPMGFGLCPRWFDGLVC